MEKSNDLWWVGFYGRILGYASSGAMVGFVVSTMFERMTPHLPWAWGLGLRLSTSIILWGSLFWLSERYEITVRRRWR
jgi:hypothetical protein